MDKAKVLKKLISQSGMSIKSFSKKCGIPSTTLYSILSRGVGKASVDVIIKICFCLELTIEELECMAKGVEYKGKSFEEVQAYIAQTRKSLSIQEKNELIKTILDEDNQIKKDA